MNNKPLFITVEGVEGVGKTTNIQFIKSYLENSGINLVLTREPGGTPLAEEVRKLLLANRVEPVDATAELLLVFAARAQHLAALIEPELSAGRWVLCDRFTDATFAYQGFGRGLPIDKIIQLETMVQNQRHPDITFYLDLPVEVGLERARKRGEADRFENEKVEFFERVREGYLTRVRENPDRYIVIDAAKSLELVQQDIKASLDDLINKTLGS